MRFKWFKSKTIKGFRDVFASDKLISDNFGLNKIYQGIEKGLHNYSLFKKFHFYRWPLWLCTSVDERNKLFRPITPPCLNNVFLREWLSFTNFLSSKHVQIDPSGMISPEHCSWSIELWVLHNQELHRPQYDLQSIIQKRSYHSGLITTEWKRKEFSLISELYGTRTSIDEAIIDVTCTIDVKPTGSSLVLVFRPYNNDILGGIKTIEFREADKSVRINKGETVHINKNPREVFTGNGAIGDINFTEKSSRSDSTYGMSSMALLFPIKKDGANIKIRLSLNEGKPVDALKLNYQNIKSDFIDYIKVMRSKGIHSSLRDSFFSDWLLNAKLIALGQVNQLSSKLTDKPVKNESSRQAFFLVKALSRTGYCEEAGFIVDTWLKSFSSPESAVLLRDAINICYLISSFTDYYTITRDSDFLKSNFEKIRNLAASIVRFGHILINDAGIMPGTSIPGFHTGENHIHDVMLFSHTMTQYSYLARTIGLFGEENKYSAEAKIINDYIRNAVTSYISIPENTIRESGAAEDPSIPYDDYFGLTSFSLFPYANESISHDEHVLLLKTISSFYKKFPVFIKSEGGLDVFLSLMIANNLLILNDNRSLDIADFLLGIGAGKYCLPAYLHPVSLNGISGEGESGLSNSMILIFLRNMLFIDTPNRLEIFPCPRKDWFVPGSEFTVENAPSRFGMIFFKVVCTINEIQLYFTELPKYIPPDILIHLPFDTAIKEGDDFVLKKESGTSFVINGWPSVIRFGRK